MARKPKQGQESAFSKLTPAEQRAWLAFIRLRLRLTYEMNRQLQAESNLSLADYDVLNALRYEPKGRTQITALAIRIGWERSRLSHHLRRLRSRGRFSACYMIFHVIRETYLVSTKTRRFGRKDVPRTGYSLDPLRWRANANQGKARRSAS